MRYAISYNNMPVTFPIFPTLTVWLLLDRLQPPGWVWGTVSTIFGLYWLLIICAAFGTRMVDVTKDLKDEWKTAKAKKELVELGLREGNP